MNKSMIVFKYFAITLSLIGLLFQLYNIIDAYLLYNSVTEITQLREDTIKIPAFVFCNYIMNSNQFFGITRKMHRLKTRGMTPKLYINRFDNLSDDTLNSFFTNTFNDRLK